MKPYAAILAALAAGTAHAADLPPARLFIASDSTAQDYAADRYPQSGWGTMLRCAFGAEVTIDNRAIGGRSTRSFIAEGRLDGIARDLRRGDTLLIQFGHNDAAVARPERYTSPADYAVNLRRYIDVAVRAGAQPVLLTPVTRRSFEGARVVPSFAAYSAAVRAVARETHTPLIDLDALSARWIEGVGAEPSKRLFLHHGAAEHLPAFPDGIADDTHFSELGARGVAEIVAGALAGLTLPISAHVAPARPALTRATPAGDASCTAAAPLRFEYSPGKAPRLISAELPEGNYRVTVKLGGRAASDTTIKAESRRLMLSAIRVRAGASATRSFVVNVRNPRLTAPPTNAPGGSVVRLNAREQGSPTWDDALTLELLGPAPALASVAIEPVAVPTIFLFGDSTVTDQRCEPGASWGQMLTAFVGADAGVANHAESGETLKSFLTGLRLDKALRLMKPGDFALVQFGHNDQKREWPQTYAEPATTYRAYLRAYIAEIRRRGATPLLVTSPERANFTPEGRIAPTLTDYAAAMRAVAAEERVTLIDLNAASIRIYEALGPSRTRLAFGRDVTHHNAYGAYVMAQAVADGVRRSGSPLAALLSPATPFDASRPPPPESFAVPASPRCPGN